ncbi:MAG TPA: hypothetical protein PKY96_04705, partial [Flavobacteriales bacterium]|nr:hypothetical protein [Flavobacteriales bacterium]
FSHLQNPTVEVSDTIPVIQDSRLRFSLEGITYHDSAIFDTLTGYSFYHGQWINNMFGGDIVHFVHVYFFQVDSMTPAGIMASSGGVSQYQQGQFIIMVNYGLTGSDDLFCHELGHLYNRAPLITCEQLPVARS